jgi:hypothetical protein
MLEGLVEAHDVGVEQDLMDLDLLVHLTNPSTQLLGQTTSYGPRTSASRSDSFA